MTYREGSGPRRWHCTLRCEISVLIGACSRTGSLTDGGEAKLGDEFTAQVLDDHLLRTDLESLGLDSGPVLLLADIAEEADDIVTLLCEQLLVEPIGIRPEMGRKMYR